MCEFRGDKKAPMVSPLTAIEHRFIDANWQRFPRWIEGYHLTMLTLLWSAGLLVAGWGVQRTGNPGWLWLASLMLFLQWFTDSFDGKLGRERGTGLKRWGFYMDHFLDYIFMTCLGIAYGIALAPTAYLTVLIFLLLFGALWVNSFLDFAATQDFKITHLGMGPTEIRLLFIAVNTFTIAFGLSVLPMILRGLNVILFVSICIIVYRTHLNIWAMDMKEKAMEEARER